jgi:WD40 repeat protein
MKPWTRIGLAALVGGSVVCACTGGTPATSAEPDPLPTCEAGADRLDERWSTPTASAGAFAYAISAGRAAVSNGDGTVGLWSLGPDAATFLGRLGDVGGAYGSCLLAFDASGERLAVTSFTGMDLWDVETGTRIGSLDLGWDAPVAVAVSDDGSAVAVASSAQVLHVWTPETGGDVPIATGFVEDVEFAPGTHDLVVAAASVSGWSPDPNLLRLDAATSWQSGAGWHLFGARGIAISPDDATVVVAAQGGFARIDLRDPNAAPVFGLANWLEPESVSFSPDGTTFAVVGAEGTVRVFSTTTLEETARRDVAIQLGGAFDEAAGGIVTVGRDGILHSLGCGE